MCHLLEVAFKKYLQNTRMKESGFFEAKVGVARKVFPRVVGEWTIRRHTWNLGAICMDRIGWPTHPGFPGTLLVLAWKTYVLGTPSVSGRHGWLVILWAESSLEALGVCRRTEFTNPRVIDMGKMAHYCSRPGAMVNRTWVPVEWLQLHSGQQ